MVLFSVEVAPDVWRDVVEIPTEGVREIELPAGRLAYAIDANGPARWIDRETARQLLMGPATWRITRTMDDGSTSVSIKRLETVARAGGPFVEVAQ